MLRLKDTGKYEVNYLKSCNQVTHYIFARNI